MNFLNPSILFGLFAVLIPVIIHLLNLRKIRKIEFSTLMFLKEIQKSKMRRIKLKQLLLLALRILVITFLVLCFSRPVYEGYAVGTGDAANSTSLIFLDDSFSMSAKTGSKINFETGKDYVKRIMENHRQSDELYFIRFSEIRLKENKFIYGDFKELEDSLNSSNVTDKTTFLSEIFNLSEEILRNSVNSNKEIYIISDFQSVIFDDYLSENSKDIKSISEADVYFTKTGDSDFRNLGLDSVTVISKLPELNKDIRVKVNLRNYSNDDLTNKVLKLFVNGTLISEKAYDIKAFDKKEAEFKFNPGNSKDINGYFELVRNDIQEDELVQDNKIFFSIHIPSGISVSVIEENPSNSSFIKIALEAAREVTSDSSVTHNKLFDIEYSNSVTGNITGKDALIISGKQEFTEAEANLIKEFILNGGGVLLFPDKNINIENYNSVFLGKLNSVTADRIIETDKTAGSPKIEKVDFEHPIISDIFSNKNLSITNDKFILESPEINSYVNFLTGQNSSAIISLSNNAPLLSESVNSKGKILFAAVSADSEMSDLPLKTVFVPLLVRSILYLGNDYEVLSDFEVGKQNLITAKGLNDIAKLDLPGGKLIDLYIPLGNKRENTFLLPYAEYTKIAGHYSVIDSSSDKFEFSLNTSPLESTNSILAEEEIINTAKSLGLVNVKFVNKPEDLESSINEARNGIGLWKYFLLGAFIFLLLEIFLSKKLEEG